MQKLQNIMKKEIAYEPNRPSNIKRYNQLGLSYFYAEQYENARNAFNACISVMKENEELFKLAMNSNDKDVQKNVYRFHIVFDEFHIMAR